MQQSTKDFRRGLTITVLPIGLLCLLAGGFRLLSDHPVAADDDTPPLPILRGSPRPHHPHPTPKPLLPVDEKTQKAAEAAVGGQIDAMTRGNYKAALEFATDEARQNWTPEDFRAMIERGYLPLSQAKQKKFSHARGTQGFCVLAVTIIDDVGRTSNFIYQLGSRTGGGMEVFSCAQVFPGTLQSIQMPRTPRRRSDDFDPISM